MNLYVFAESGLATKWKTESSSVGVCPPDHVTVWMTVESPEPVDCTSRFQPGAASKESIPKPAGGVSSTCVVVAPSFSVGTASVKYWSVFDLATDGLSDACPNAAGAAARAATVAAAARRTRRRRAE